MPAGPKHVLRLGKCVRMRDCGCGHRAEADACLAKADGEIYLVPADEQADVRQAHLEEDVRADQCAVKEVAVARKETDLLHFGTAVRDLAVQAEEKGKPVRLPGRRYQRDHRLQVACLSLPEQRGE